MVSPALRHLLQEAVEGAEEVRLLQARLCPCLRRLHQREVASVVVEEVAVEEVAAEAVVEEAAKMV